MQSNQRSVPSSISPKPAADPDPPPVFNDEELSLLETKQHLQAQSSTQQRGGSEQQSWDDQLAEKPVADPRPESSVLGKTVTKNKKRGIQFKGWSNERVVHAPKVEGGRIILMLDSDPPAQRKKVEKVVRMMETDLAGFFLRCLRIVGCLVAELIKEAHTVLSFAIDGSSFDGTTTNETKSSTLQFGEIRFHREVIRKASAAPEPSSNEHLNGAIICEKEAITAVCGVRAIWVTPANRRKQIATQLLDALRKSFCMGFVFERSQLTVSQLTSAGRALISNYIGDGHLLVYNTNSGLIKQKQ